MRAWTIRKGWTAPQAGVIHADFKRGFIKAEIVSYEDLVVLRSVHHVMRDGDVVEFRGSTCEGGVR